MQDSLTRHQILIQRHLKSIYSDIKPLLNDMIKDINARMAKATVEEFDRLTILINDINAIIASGTRNISETSMQRLFDFYEYETRFTEKLLDSETVPSVTIMGASMSPEYVMDTVSAVRMNLDGVSITVPQMIEQFGQAQSKSIGIAIRSGLVQGKTTQQIVQDVMKLTDTRTSKQAESVILTAGNAVGREARNSVWKKYDYLIDYEIVRATLDSKTSLFCMQEDSKKYPVGQGQTFPAHFRCRTIRVPVLKKEYDLNYDTKRSSTEGAISAKTTYEQFLKRQSKAFQYEALGKTRADMFRKGEIKLDQFVDSSGKEYTLEQLRSLGY